MARAFDTVYFLSDYGADDELAGVVRAVLRRCAPLVAVIDLTHGTPPFDVPAGAAALVRAVPYLGPAVVLAVVDPGVGGARRAVALEVTGPEPLTLVGPDNGLLVPAAQARGPMSRAVALDRDIVAGALRGQAGPRRSAPLGSRQAGPRRSAPLGARQAGAPPSGAGATFDGRDLFAPAAALLCRGADLASLGATIDLDELAVLQAPPEATLRDGVIETQVTWVDHFGNVQLAAGAPADVRARWRLGRWRLVRGDAEVPVTAVNAFGELSPGELGLLVDSCAKLALVLDQQSAAAALSLRTGDAVRLVCREP